jgi:hypothetical protein
MNHRVATSTARLWRELANKTREQRARGRKNDHDERIQHEMTFLAEDLLAVGPQGRVAGEPLEQKRLGVLEASEESGADESRRETNHRCVEQRPAQDAQVKLRRNAPERGADRDHAEESA